MTTPGGALRARLGELARARRSGVAPDAPSHGPAPDAPGELRDRSAPHPAEPSSRRGSLRHPGSREPRTSAPSHGASGACAVPVEPLEPSASSDDVAFGSSLSGAFPAAVGVEAFLPGGEWRDERGAVFVHERLRSDVEKRKKHWGRLDAAPAGEPDLAALCAVGLEHALFLDLETGGLTSSPVFLAGTMHWNGSDFVLRQYFARHYGEEATLLAALAEATRGFEFLVTFNGKSYDVPFLRDRGNVHRVRIGMPPRHVDLLHPARRRWKGELPDCRLQTLEYRVCRRRRAGDVPGEEVPGLYHDYVRDGDPYRLVPVFHHNLLDVITMGDVLGALCR